MDDDDFPLETEDDLEAMRELERDCCRNKKLISSPAAASNDVLPFVPIIYSW